MALVLGEKAYDTNVCLSHLLISVLHRPATQSAREASELTLVNIGKTHDRMKNEQRSMCPRVTISVAQFGTFFLEQYCTHVLQDRNWKWKSLQIMLYDTSKCHVSHNTYMYMYMYTYTPCACIMFNVYC